jgi:hypothetical protein
MHDEDELAQVGCLRAEDSNDHVVDDPRDDDGEHDLDLTLHHPPEAEDTPPVSKTEGWVDMGERPIARSAKGLTVVNTLEVLPPFELSI